MNLILVNPAGWRHLLPLSATRPVAELRIGILTIAEKWENRFGISAHHLVHGYLSEGRKIQSGEDNLFVIGGLLPEKEITKQIINLSKGLWLLDSEGNFLAARLDQENAERFISTYVTSGGNPQYSDLAGQSIKAEGQPRQIRHTWDIFMKNGEELASDYQWITSGRVSAVAAPGNQIIGERLFIEEGAKVQCAILNTSTGPIYIGKNSEVMEGSVIRGPFGLCEGATVKLSAKIYGPTTIGPYCKVGGELNNVVMQANSNKAHDGFLGNAAIGEWCNLGADTNNSNLKNTYAEVKLWDYAANSFVKTGSIFCGLVMGDHAKCGINTMFNT
ncbi:MAG TPA: putative sugar nucleotidyl transferase, partial [Saprospiraceae bacterium]|nr:putative sugar nucleotidyl transferase [Saprospiraceae bacterium]